RRDLGARIEALEVADVDGNRARAVRAHRHRVLRVRAAQLAEAHVDRHLAALEARPHLVRPRASLLALEPAGRVAPLAGAHATADALAVLARLRGLQVRKVELLGHYASSTFTRWRTFLSIPASCGLSWCSAERPILPRPSARSVPRCLWLWPIWLRVCVTRIFVIARLFLGRRRVLLLCLRRLDFLFDRRLRRHRQHLRDRQTADLRDLLGPAQPLEPVDGRLQHVDRVRGAEALRQDVADPAELEDGADTAAGDHSGSLAGRP